MKGFIVNINRVKEEDLIVTILSQKNLETLYRFYGARHGVINLGFLIDFEVEKNAKSTIGRLKDVVHIGFGWIHQRERLQLWQSFSALFYKHLQDADENVAPFYYKLLEDASQLWGEQNPKRVAIESYVKLLRHEGRLHTEPYCFLCSRKLENNIALLRAFLPTHPECSHAAPLHMTAIKELYSNHSSLFLDDAAVDQLWSLLLEGL